jgi:hypothetical protein
MPWVSTFADAELPPGDGGGVSATRPELLGRCSLKRNVDGRGGDGSADESEPECERFCFFAAC